MREISSEWLVEALYTFWKAEFQYFGFARDSFTRDRDDRGKLLRIDFARQPLSLCYALRQRKIALSII